MDSGISEYCKKHALILAVNQQAHVVGIYRLALQLAEGGVTVTFVSTENDTALLQTFDELRGLDFNAVSYGPGYTTKQDADGIVQLHKDLFSQEISFRPICDKLVANQKAGIPGPTCLIADRFLPWVKDVARELNLPYYLFFSNGAIYARQVQSTPEMLAAGKYVLDADSKQLSKFEGFLKIPGLPSLRFGELPSFSRLVPSMPLAISIAMLEADGVILNTFYELEAPQIDAMQQSFVDSSRGKFQKLFLVGPISNATSFKDRSFVSGLEADGRDCLKWLDTQPPQSVLYIGFGSMARWTPRQINELALALETSEQRFLWLLPGGADKPSLEEVLPPGYEGRMSGKGLVATGWVPQLKILGHFAVGGFLTHCGWNSLIESISSGVPMIGWPQFAEQSLNCRYLVDVLKIAVEVGTVTESGRDLIKCAELEQAIRLLMVEEGAALRSRVQDLMVKARAAVADGGCSQRAIIELIACIPGRGDCTNS